MSSKISKSWLLTVLLCPVFFLKFSHAEVLTTAPADRPKIALVLEGGGALGFAHAGVLRVLERE